MKTELLLEEISKLYVRRQIKNNIRLIQEMIKADPHLKRQYGQEIITDLEYLITRYYELGDEDIQCVNFKAIAIKLFNGVE